MADVRHASCRATRPEGGMTRLRPGALPAAFREHDETTPIVFDGVITTHLSRAWIPSLRPPKKAGRAHKGAVNDSVGIALLSPQRQMTRDNHGQLSGMPERKSARKLNFYSGLSPRAPETTARETYTSCRALCKNNLGALCITLSITGINPFPPKAGRGPMSPPKSVRHPKKPAAYP